MSDSNVTPIRRVEPDCGVAIAYLSIRMERVRHVLDLYVRSIEPQAVPALELLRTELAEIEAEIERLE